MENVDAKEGARDDEDSAREIGMVSPYLPRNGYTVPGLPSKRTLYLFFKTNYRIIVLTLILICIAAGYLSRYRTNQRREESTIKVNRVRQMHAEYSAKKSKLLAEIDSVKDENRKKAIHDEIEKLNDAFIEYVLDVYNGKNTD